MDIHNKADPTNLGMPERQALAQLPSEWITSSRDQSNREKALSLAIAMFGHKDLPEKPEFTLARAQAFLTFLNGEG